MLNMRSQKKVVRGEQGQTLPLVALLLFVVVGMVALTIDVGIFFHERRDLQNAADAAALAGAQALPEDPDEAVALATQWASENGISASELESVEVSTTDYPNDTITVEVKRDVNFVFASVLGIVSAENNARAAAQAGSLSGATGLAPFGVLEDAISYCSYSQIILSPVPPACVSTLKYDVNDTGATIGDLDFDGKGGGANELYQKILGGNKDPLCSINEAPPPGCATQEPSKSGNSTGQIRDGMNWRLSNTTSQCDTILEVIGPDTNGDGRPEVRPECNPWSVAATDTDGDGGICDNISWQGSLRGSCRLIAIPIIQGSQLPPPDEDVVNVGFALFWLLPLVNGLCSGNDCTIFGVFIDAEVSISGLLGQFNPDNTPFRVVSLIE